MNTLFLKIKSFFVEDTTEELDTPVEVDFNKSSFMRRNSSEGALVVFLDFDGVLHQGFNESFEYRENFLLILDQFPMIEVIFSTSWRYSAAFDYLLDIFPKEYHERFIGITPRVDDPPFQRHAEIQLICRQFQIEHYIAIDDAQELFPEECHYLFWVDSRDALNSKNLTLFENYIRGKIELNNCFADV